MTVEISGYEYDGEAKTARSLRTPEPPTDAARMSHNATHVPFRDWSPICVASRGRSSPHSEEEESGSVGELSTVCSHTVLKYFFLARIGRTDFFWSVNKLARAVTKWTKTCGKRLARLISYIHHTCEYRQYCYVGNTA